MASPPPERRRHPVGVWSYVVNKIFAVRSNYWPIMRQIEIYRSVCSVINPHRKPNRSTNATKQELYDVLCIG